MTDFELGIALTMGCRFVMGMAAITVWSPFQALRGVTSAARRSLPNHVPLGGMTVDTIPL
jgi:hypothetical protein